MGEFAQSIGKGLVGAVAVVEPQAHAMAASVEQPAPPPSQQPKAEPEQHVDEESKVPAPWEIRDSIVAAATTQVTTYYVGPDHSLLHVSTRLPFHPLNEYFDRPVF